MPGKRLHVVFDAPEAKNEAEQFMQATIHGVTCRVVESGQNFQFINVYHYPYEEDNSPLLAVLGGYGEVRDIRYQRYSSSATLSTGNRLHWKPSGAQKTHTSLYCHWVCYQDVECGATD